ncbi:sulfite exporter TauE/SafE family protein [Bacteroidota bacterium]
MDEIIYIIITGAFTGFSSGMFGIGGSVVATPFLSLLLGIVPIMAIATPLPAAIPSALSGSYLYQKKKMINYKFALIVLLTAIPLGWLGSYTTGYIDQTVLIILKAVFLIILGLKFFISSWLMKGKVEEPKLSITGGLISGALAGFVAGILAVGGGIVLVTAFVRINNLPMKNAVATSLFCVLILAIANSIKHFQMGHIDLNITWILAISVIPFAYLGAKTAVSLRNKTLERVFGAAMIIFAIFFIITQIA